VSHDRERLILAVLAGSQPGDCGVVCCVAREVPAAEPFDRDNGAVSEQLNGSLDRERESRPAQWAAGCLGVKAAVAWIVVLAAAVGAEREASHRGVGAVVRD
jgi:hypothetical protein